MSIHRVIVSRNFADYKALIQSFTKIFLFYLLVITNSGQAQNLVPNPSFEILDSYPSCWTSSGKSDFNSQISDWFLPNNGTTDLLSTQVSPSCITAMPYSEYPSVNWFPRGSQLPRTGNTFAGIKPLFNERREYLEVELTCTLIPGQAYYCEMYVSLSENTNYAQNSLGMYFSDTRVDVDTTAMLSFTPQIVESKVIDDTINWVRVSGTFTATSPSQYLVIGSFAKYEDMDVKFLGNKGDINFTYYFIDDVLVKPVNVPPVFISGDTVICKGEQLQLQASGWNNCNWYSDNGSQISYGNELKFTPTQSTTILLKGSYCKVILSRKVEVIVNSLPSLSLGKDTLICEGTTILIDGGAGFSQYTWQDQSHSQQLNVSTSGKYSVEITDGNGCHANDEIVIGYYKLPSVNLGEDYSTCVPLGVLTATTQQPYDSFLWQDHSTLNYYTFNSEGKYWVEVQNICGATSSDTIVIDRISMFVPNLLTANKDELNDEFAIAGIERGKGTLSVFNKYGSPVYESNSYMNNWAADDLPDGVYFFQFSYPTCSDIKGWIHVVR